MGKRGGKGASQPTYLLSIGGWSIEKKGGDERPLKKGKVEDSGEKKKEKGPAHKKKIFVASCPCRSYSSSATLKSSVWGRERERGGWGEKKVVSCPFFLRSPDGREKGKKKEKRKCFFLFFLGKKKKKRGGSWRGGQHHIRFEGVLPIGGKKEKRKNKQTSEVRKKRVLGR